MFVFDDEYYSRRDEIVQNPVLNENNYQRYVKASEIFPEWLSSSDDIKVPLSKHFIFIQFNENTDFSGELLEKLITFLNLMDIVTIFADDPELTVIGGAILNIYEEKV